MGPTSPRREASLINLPGTLVARLFFALVMPTRTNQGLNCKNSNHTAQKQHRQPSVAGWSPPLKGSKNLLARTGPKTTEPAEIPKLNYDCPRHPHPCPAGNSYSPALFCGTSPERGLIYQRLEFFGGLPQWMKYSGTSVTRQNPPYSRTAPNEHPGFFASPLIPLVKASRLLSASSEIDAILRNSSTASSPHAPKNSNPIKARSLHIPTSFLCQCY